MKIGSQNVPESPYDALRRVMKEIEDACVVYPLTYADRKEVERQRLEAYVNSVMPYYFP